MVQDFMTDEPNKLAFDHLFSGIIICFKYKFNKKNICPILMIFFNKKKLQALKNKKIILNIIQP